MVKTIVRNELLRRIQSKEYLVIFLICSLSVLLAFLTSYTDYSLRLQDYRLQQSKVDGSGIVVPPNPLGILARGLDESMTRLFDISEATGQVAVGSRQHQANAVFSLFPPPDVLYVVKVILSLAAVLLAFDSICGEKENARLGLILSNPIPRAKLILAKLLAGHILLALTFFPAFLLGLLLVTSFRDYSLASEDVTRTVVFLILSTVYLSFFFNFAAAVSARTSSSKSSLVFVTFFWAIIVFAVPNTGALLARKIVKLPSIQWLETKNTQAWISVVFENIRREPQDRLSHADLKRRIDEETSRVESTYLAALDQVRRYGDRLSSLSPAACLVYSATAAVGSSATDELALKRAVLRYKRAVVALGGREAGGFTFLRRPLAQAASEVLRGGAIILLFSTASLAFAFMSFATYDAR